MLCSMQVVRITLTCGQFRLESNFGVENLPMSDQQCKGIFGCVSGSRMPIVAELFLFTKVSSLIWPLDVSSKGKHPI